MYKQVSNNPYQAAVDALKFSISRIKYLGTISNEVHRNYDNEYSIPKLEKALAYTEKLKEAYSMTETQGQADDLLDEFMNGETND